MKFSIIMPVYNASGYLHDAVDSVLRQSFKDFELILVDDGSRDGSTEVCKEYAENDARVVFIKQQNSGICHARNVGMQVAHGEYIGFCDHDDEYLPGFLNAVELAIENHSDQLLDFVKVNHDTHDRWDDRRTQLTFSGYACEEGFWNRQCYNDSLFRNFIGTVWDGFYRRTFIIENGLCFDESFKCGGEDFLFNLMVMNKVGFAWHCGAHHYYRHYLNHGTSTSSKSHPELVESYFKSIHFELAHFESSTSNLAHRFNYWKSNFLSYIFLSAGNRISLLKASSIIGRVAKLLLPSDRVMQTELALPLKLLVHAKLYFLLGFVVMVKWGVLRRR